MLLIHSGTIGKMKHSSLFITGSLAQCLAWGRRRHSGPKPVKVVGKVDAAGGPLARLGNVKRRSRPVGSIIFFASIHETKGERNLDNVVAMMLCKGQDLHVCKWCSIYTLKCRDCGVITGDTTVNGGTGISRPALSTGHTR